MVTSPDPLFGLYLNHADPESDHAVPQYHGKQKISTHSCHRTRTQMFTSCALLSSAPLRLAAADAASDPLGSAADAG